MLSLQWITPSLVAHISSDEKVGRFYESSSEKIACFVPVARF